jgi:TrmH family RNA methyltransferase
MKSISKTELKKIKSLLTKKGRQVQRMFLAEGIRLLEESIRFRFWPHTVYYAPAMSSNRGLKLIKQFERQLIETKKLSAGELESVSGAEAPQGIVGLFAVPEMNLSKLYQPRCRKLLLCENISDPGNLGTLVRSALAFGFDLVLLCGSTAEPYAPKAARASAGAIFGLPMAEVTPKELDTFLSKEQIMVIASDLRGDVDISLPKKELKNKKIVLAVGSEATGLSKRILDRADLRLRIPHSRAVESLNAAVAGSILMKEVYDNVR